MKTETLLFACPRLYQIQICQNALCTIYTIIPHISLIWSSGTIEAHTGTPPAADWKRPPGRPRRNWLHQVEEVGAARIAGQDHSMWRALRPSAGQAQQ